MHQTGRASSQFRALCAVRNTIYATERAACCITFTLRHMAQRRSYAVLARCDASVDQRLRHELREHPSCVRAEKGQILVCALLALALHMQQRNCNGVDLVLLHGGYIYNGARRNGAIEAKETIVTDACPFHIST